MVCFSALPVGVGVISAEAFCVFRESSELHAGRKTPVLSHPVHVPAFLVVEHLQEEPVSP